jgi:hypothetical protein
MLPLAHALGSVFPNSADPRDEKGSLAALGKENAALASGSIVKFGFGTF